MDYQKLLTEQGRMHLAIESAEGALLVNAVGDTLETWSDLSVALEQQTQRVERGIEDATSSMHAIDSVLNGRVTALFAEVIAALESATISGQDAAKELRAIQDLLRKEDCRNDAMLEDALNHLRNLV